MSEEKCKYYGDCDHNCECPEDEPWARCIYRVVEIEGDLTK